MSDAQLYEAAARDEWNNNDTTAAQRDFHTAEHILRMATRGRNFEPAFLGENPEQQKMMTERAIKQAQASGMDVSDAEHYYNEGKSALDNGNREKASSDFRAAQLTLDIPVEVGYAEVWESEVPANGEYRAAANDSQTQQSGTGTTSST